MQKATRYLVVTINPTVAVWVSLKSLAYDEGRVEADSRCSSRVRFGVELNCLKILKPRVVLGI